MRKVVKTFLKHCLTQWIFCWIAALYIKFVYRTNHWHRIGFSIPEVYIQQAKPFLMCFWHNRLGMMVYIWKWPLPFKMLISPHPDGQLIAKTVAHFNITTIYGSSTHGGTKALRALIRELKEGAYVGVTPDGPRGPCQQAAPGVIFLAKMAGTDIIPTTYATSRRCLLNTWDHFHFPLPFGRGVLAYGSPISVPPDADAALMEQKRQEVEGSLTLLQKRVDELCGHVS